MKNMKKNPKQNRESSLMRSPLILGLSIVLCIPVAYSHAKSSNIVKNESVQSILQGRTIKGQIIDENNEPLIGVSVIIKGASTIGTSRILTGIMHWKFLPEKMFSKYPI